MATLYFNNQILGNGHVQHDYQHRVNCQHSAQQCPAVCATARPTLQASLSGTRDIGKLCLDLRVKIPPTGPASGALPSHVCNQSAWVPRSSGGSSARVTVR